MSHTDYWSRTLAQAPLAALEEELARRADEEHTTILTIEIGDLLVDPIRSMVRWRGDEHIVPGRRMQVVYALASSWVAGHRALASSTLAWMVWRGWEKKGALENLHFVVSALRVRVPGLIGGGMPKGAGYWLNVDRRAGAHRIEAA